jgi:hypothetical protein
MVLREAVMTQAARLLVTFGLAASLASAAWAGPTGGSPTPTPTATPTATGTGSPTPIPTATATATATGSPTPIPTATATPTATAIPTATATPTASPSPSSTPQPGDLSGTHTYVDKRSFDKHESFFNIDTSSGEICLQGQTVGIDPTETFNRRVIFTYEGQGTITKSSSKGVKGDFPNVALTLYIEELTDPTTPEFEQTITTSCKLKGQIKKSGEAAKTSLRCKVGKDFFDFFGPITEDNQPLLENVTEAYPRRKGLNANTKNGNINFKQNGEPAPEGLVVPLSCDLGATPSPTPSPE